MTDSGPTFAPSKLVALRKERGMSQRALATAGGVSQALIAEVERGKHPPSSRSVERIAAALGCSISDLMS